MPSSVGRLLPQAVSDPSRQDIEAPVTMQLQAAVPLKGKRALTVTAPMTATFADIKRLIAKQEEMYQTAADIEAKAPSRLTIRIDQIEQPCDNDSSLYLMGYDFPPLMHIAGFAHEYALRVHGSSQRWPAPWWPHITATDLMRHVQARLKPYDLRYCRAAAYVEDPPGSGRQRRVEIPISRTFTYAVGVELSERTTIEELRSKRGAVRAAALARFADVVTSAGYNLQQLGFDEDNLRSAEAAAAATPRQLIFVRSQNAIVVRFYIDVRPDVEAEITIGDIRKAIVKFCEEKGAEQLTRDDPSRLLQETPKLTITLDTQGALAQEARAVVEEHQYPEEPIRDPMEDLADPFDDDDEEIAPRGVRRTFCHDRDVLMATSSESRALAQEIKFTREASEVHAKVEKLLTEIRSEPLVLSFNPPKNQFQAVALPSFVDACDDFSIRHLSDMGVRPGTEVFIEYYDPHTQQWSDEIVKSVETAWTVQGPMPKDSPKLAGISGGLLESTRRSSLVTVKNRRGLLHRFDVPPDVAHVEHIARLHFCATGDLPMFHLFAADGGRFLNLSDVVVPLTARSTGVLPSPTIYVVHRPRPWLGETWDSCHVVADPTSSDAQLNSVAAPAGL